MAAASPGKASVNQCGGTSRTGKPCGHPAGFGTDHGGFGNCKFHGGCSPDGNKHAAKLQARHLAVEVDMEPHDALLWMVRVASGEVVWLTAKISELDETELLVEHVVERDSWGGDNATSYVQKSTAATLHMWVQARAAAADRLVRYAKTALDAGVQERQVRLAEEFGDKIARALDGIFGELDLTPEQLKKAAPAVERHLWLIEGGAQAA